MYTWSLNLYTMTVQHNVSPGIDAEPSFICAQHGLKFELSTDETV